MRLAKRVKWTRRRLSCVFLLSGMPVFGWVCLSWLVVPRGDIDLLANGHVETVYRDGRAHYTIVKAEPEAWTPLDAVSEKARLAIVAAEDSRFYRHFGFDLPEIRHALVEAVREGKPPRGASTITQQVAKNLFLTREYSVWRKIKELAIALELEQELSKSRILEVYLNTIEYGEGIYGIAAASTHYFGKPPAGLTVTEGAFLATLLPNPDHYEQELRAHGVTPQTRERMHKILGVMREQGHLSKEEVQQLSDAPLHFSKEAAGTQAK